MSATKASGLHAKRFLIRIGDERWSAVGNLYGSEISHKPNRVVVVMVEHPLVYERLLEVFLHDWTLVTRKRRLPHVSSCYKSTPFTTGVNRAKRQKRPLG